MLMPSQSTGGESLFGNNFPNPFLDVATMAMPKSLRNALQWCEFIWLSNGVYRMAMERVASYFLTEIDVGGEDVGDDEKEKWESFMSKTVDVLLELHNATIDRLAYGNSFTSLIVPFKRFLTCPKCGSSYPLSVVYENNIFRFSWSNMQFVAECPTCKVGSKYRGPWKVDDKPGNYDKIHVKHWPVHEIEILHDLYTDDTAYLWRIPEDYKQSVRKGHLFHLERVSKPLLNAIKHNQMFRFHPDALYHMKEPTLCGVRNRGWGIPRTLSNFRQIYYVQVLRRYNEAIALDYVMPFRLITPQPRTGTVSSSSGQAQDPLLTFGGSNFAGSIQAMLRQQRRDPASWHTLPFAVNAQFIGGDASKLAPRDLMDQGNEELLNACGVPIEMFKGTLQLQAAPVALRLFEATWHPLTRDANSWLSWFAKQIGQIRSWEDVEPKLKPPTIADDAAKAMAVLQLTTGQMVSKTTGLASVGVKYKEEVKRMGQEAQFEAEQQAESEKEMQMAGFSQQMAAGQVSPGQGQTGGGSQDPSGGGGGGGGGGDPSQGSAPGQAPVDQYIATMGPNTPQTPTEMTSAAQSLAQQLLGLPDGVKNQQLAALKKKSEVMHALVRAQIDAIRGKARSQGGAAVIAQNFGGQGGQGGGGGGQ
jgi:hypothetical protein